MNFKLVLSSCLLAAAYGQFVSPKDAKILKEQRFNTGDGRFGSAYAQEDGVVFREETSADGERVGQYSYIDNDGKTITVKYTAGKDGFRILEGDHVPTGANGLNSAAFNPNHAAAAPPVQAAPLRQASLPVAAVPQSFDYSDYEDIPVDPNFNPFINPHDPTHRNFQHNVNAAQFNPQQLQAAPQQPQFAPQQPQFSPQQPQFAPQQPQFAPSAHAASSVPACADCAGVNPFINPHDFSHQQGRFVQPSAPVQQVQPAFRQQQFVPQQQRFAPQQQQFAPQQQQFSPQQQQFVPQQQQFVPQQQQLVQQPPTETPRRFFPPGQLQLNRFETGFNFDFSS